MKLVTVREYILPVRKVLCLCYCRLSAVENANNKLQEFRNKVVIISRLTAPTTDSTMSFRIRSVSTGWTLKSFKYDEIVCFN